MLNIGIEKHQGLVYEGTGRHGRAVWPTPIITPAKIVFNSEGPLIAERKNDSTTQACRFREDFYDPIARIRRGRFYQAWGSQPSEWFVQPHPALLHEHKATDKHDLRKSLENFHGAAVWSKYIRGRTEQPLVLLGRDDCFTIWTIIDIETIATGEELVTLKARSSFGVLPEIDRNRIPEDYRPAVLESLNVFADEVHRAAPASVIDRARDAASYVLIAYFGASGENVKDLSKMADSLGNEKRFLAANAARSIALLHSRTKPSEQERREIRTVREQDAQLATQLVGTILCEIGWANWG